MSIGERIADTFTQSLDLAKLTNTQCWILHGIKSVAVRQWARETLNQERGY